MTPTPERNSAIPLIDLTEMAAHDADCEAAIAAAIGRAAREVGVFHLSGHGIPASLIRRLRNAAQRFFSQPVADKMACYIGDSRNHRGYVPEGEEQFGDSKDRKEAFDLALDLAVDTTPADHPMLGPNRWPTLPGFREDVMAYYAAAFALGRRLMRWFALALGHAPDFFTRHITTPPSQLRLVHYPYDPDAADTMGIGAHTDYECFTLLLATAPGLEVMDASGRWIDAPPIGDALVVNIGDMLEYWSNGAFIATSHRVRKVSQERFSFPLFFAVDYNTRIAPDGQRGHDAPPLVAGEHLYAQTLRTFAYLKQRIAAGEITAPANTYPLTSFGQAARRRSAAPPLQSGVGDPSS